MNSKDFEDEINCQITGSLYDARGYASHPSYLSSEKGRSVVERFKNPMQKQQGMIRSRLIRMIEERGLKPIGMLTLSPYRSLDQDQLDQIMKHIHESCRRRFDPRGRAGYAEPILAIREKNGEGKGMHLHLLFAQLNTNPKMLTKNVLTYGVQEAVQSACKRFLGSVDDCVPRLLLYEPKFHAHLYEYAIRNPINLDRFKNDAYRGCRYIPNSHQGMKWSLVRDCSLSDAKVKCQAILQFDGFSGWRGLVAYMTKGIFSNDDLSKYLCGETFAKFARLPVSPRSSLSELFK